MNKTFKRGLRWFGIALVVLSVMFNALAYNHAKAMLCFTETEAMTRKPEELSFWTNASKDRPPNRKREPLIITNSH